MAGMTQVPEVKGVDVINGIRGEVILLKND
jgi:hypothetical protein